MGSWGFWDQLNEIYPNPLFASFDFECETFSVWSTRENWLVWVAHQRSDIPSITKITNKNVFSKTRIWIQLDERSILSLPDVVNSIHAQKKRYNILY